MTSDKMRTKDELVNELKLYQGILSDSVFQYLNSLIEANVSVIRKNENITNVQRRILSEIDIYRNIAIYNIRERAKSIFLTQNERGDGRYYNTYISGEEVLLFWHHDQKNDFENIPDGYKTMQIGKIQLYKTIWSEEKRILEIDRIREKLAKLYAENENSDMESYRKRYVIPGSIKKYKSILAELENRHKPNAEQEKVIEITSRIHDLFMNDYGLSSNDFEETQKEMQHRLTGDKFMQEYKQASEMEKVLVKRIPNLTIESHITYL